VVWGLFSPRHFMQYAGLDKIAKHAVAKTSILIRQVMTCFRIVALEETNNKGKTWKDRSPITCLMPSTIVQGWVQLVNKQTNTDRSCVISSVF